MLIQIINIRYHLYNYRLKSIKIILLFYISANNSVYNLIHGKYCKVHHHLNNIEFTIKIHT